MDGKLLDLFGAHSRWARDVAPLHQKPEEQERQGVGDLLGFDFPALADQYFPYHPWSKPPHWLKGEGERYSTESRIPECAINCVFCIFRSAVTTYTLPRLDAYRVRLYILQVLPYPAQSFTCYIELT
jgi:hypothetical protein